MRECSACQLHFYHLNENLEGPAEPSVGVMFGPDTWLPLTPAPGSATLPSTYSRLSDMSVTWHPTAPAEQVVFGCPGFWKRTPTTPANNGNILWTLAPRIIL